MDRRAIREQIIGWAAVTWLLFASFTYYVTFVQFSLLIRAKTVLGLSEADLAPGFALLALCGICGSLAAGWRLDRRPVSTRGRLLGVAALSAWLAACAAAAMIAPGRWSLVALFAPLGAGLGVLIVLLLVLFNSLVPARVRGFFAGVAAAACYLAANVMAAVGDSPNAIGKINLGLALADVALVFFFFGAVRALPENELGRPATIPAMLRRLWLLALVVAVDTALFVHVSRAPGRWPVFSGAREWVFNGGAHAVAALLAGVFYSRWGWFRLTRWAAYFLVGLVALFTLHRFGVVDCRALIVPVYAVVVGFYTVALFTVFGEETPAGRPALGIGAGMVLVGWIASPLGIGLGTALLR